MIVKLLLILLLIPVLTIHAQTTITPDRQGTISTTSGFTGDILDTMQVGLFYGDDGFVGIIDLTNGKTYDYSTNFGRNTVDTMASVGVDTEIILVLRDGGLPQQPLVSQSSVGVDGIIDRDNVNPADIFRDEVNNSNDRSFFEIFVEGVVEYFFPSSEGAPTDINLLDIVTSETDISITQDAIDIIKNMDKTFQNNDPDLIDSLNKFEENLNNLETTSPISNPHQTNTGSSVIIDKTGNGVIMSPDGTVTPFGPQDNPHIFDGDGNEIIFNKERAVEPKGTDDHSHNTGDAPLSDWPEHQIAPDDHAHDEDGEVVWELKEDQWDYCSGPCYPLDGSPPDDGTPPTGDGNVPVPLLFHINTNEYTTQTPVWPDQCGYWINNGLHNKLWMFEAYSEQKVCMTVKLGGDGYILFMDFDGSETMNSCAEMLCNFWWQPNYNVYQYLDSPLFNTNADDKFGEGDYFWSITRAYSITDGKVYKMDEIHPAQKITGFKLRTYDVVRNDYLLLGQYANAKYHNMDWAYDKAINSGWVPKFYSDDEVRIVAFDGMGVEINGGSSYGKSMDFVIGFWTPQQVRDAIK